MSNAKINRNLPDGVVRKLLDLGLVNQPSEVVDSAEGALLLPQFESKRAFDEWLAELEKVSVVVAAELREEAEQLRNNGGRGAESEGPPAGSPPDTAESSDR